MCLLTLITYHQISYLKEISQVVTPAKIIHIHRNKTHIEYQCKFNIEDYSKFFMMEREIIRKLTPDEIEEYEIKINMKKYNL